MVRRCVNVRNAECLVSHIRLSMCCFFIAPLEVTGREGVTLSLAFLNTVHELFNHTYLHFSRAAKQNRLLLLFFFFHFEEIKFTFHARKKASFHIVGESANLIKLQTAGADGLEVLPCLTFLIMFVVSNLYFRLIRDFLKCAQ